MPNSDLTLEKLKVSERLTTLETSVALLIQKIDHHIDHDKELMVKIDKRTEKLEHIVIGNGKIGLVGKVDSLEKLRNHINFLWGAVVVAAIKSTIDYITKHVS